MRKEPNQAMKVREKTCGQEKQNGNADCDYDIWHRPYIESQKIEHDVYC